MIAGHDFGALIADKAFAADWIIEELQRRIENYFGKLKEFKRIAMPACKTDSSFAAMIHAGAAVIQSR